MDDAHVGVSTAFYGANALWVMSPNTVLANIGGSSVEVQGVVMQAWIVRHLRLKVPTPADESK